MQCLNVYNDSEELLPYLKSTQEVETWDNGRGGVATKQGANWVLEKKVKL